MFWRQKTLRWTMILLLVIGGAGGPFDFIGMIHKVNAAVDDGSVNNKERAKQLMSAAETLYQHVIEGNVNRVRKDIEQVGIIFESSSFQGMTSVEGIHALAEAIIEMKEAAAQAQIRQEDWLNASAKLRLAADSLGNSMQPMWLQYYKVIREDLSEMKASAAMNDRVSLSHAYDNLQNHYETIRPAMIIQRKSEEVTSTDAWLSYAGGIALSPTAKSADVQSMVESGEELFNGLFGKKRDTPAFAPIDEVNGSGKWAVLTGSFIVLVLAYVGYRKYRGERDSINSITPKL